MDRIGELALVEMDRIGYWVLVGLECLVLWIWIGLDNEVWGFVKEWVKGLVEMDGKG